MNEREIFAAALEQPTEAERQAFLDEVCDGDMRSRIERLLKEQSQLGSFLEHPPLEADADALHGIEATIQYGNSSTYDEDDAQHTEQLDMSQSPREQNDEIPLGFLQPSSQSDSLGRLGHYEILEVVGRGAFGTVLRAFDKKLQRVVAAKVLAPEMAATSPARKRFLREARTSAQIRHENVVAIYAVEDDPIPYLVMEYIPGKTLQQRLDEHGPLDLPDVLRLGKQIADGLAAAHEQGLIHRDIKPGNILLEGGMDERVKITDFGLARTADDASLTQSGVIAGTPLYMAPEQVEGKKLDQRADLFSLGSVLYQMLTGRPPFRAPTTMGVLKRVAEDTPRPIQEIIPETPEWMCQLISHLHAKDPEDRFDSAQAVSDLLARCLADLEAGRVPEIPDPAKPVADEETPTTAHASPEKSVVRSPLVKVAAAVLILLSLLGITEATGVTKLASTVIRLTTGSGTLVIETDDPGVKITIDGEEVTITGGGVESITLRPGDYTVTALKNGKPVKQELVSITRNGRKVVRMSLEPALKVASSSGTPSGDGWHGWPADAPPPAISPFDIEQAKAHQEAWAKYLGVPVEYANNIGMKFRLIPPGEFLMGSTPEEIEAALKVAGKDKAWRERIQSEAPQHKVILTQPVYVGVNEVTQAQYEQVMGTNPSHFSASGDGKDAVANLETGNHPVERVNWNDAAEFCAKLSQQEELKPFYFRSGETVTPLEGTGYRLPTEAEWEYVCRAGTTTRFWSGDQDSDLLAAGWFGYNAGGRTHVTGKLGANPFGLFDVHGNVWEWAQDSYDPGFYGRSTENSAVDPSSPLFAGSQRVLRGGNWHSDPSVCRSADRVARRPSLRFIFIGFRVVLVVDAVKHRPSAPLAATSSTPARPDDGARAKAFKQVIKPATAEKLSADKSGPPVEPVA